MNIKNIYQVIFLALSLLSLGNILGKQGEDKGTYGGGDFIGWLIGFVLILLAFEII